MLLNLTGLVECYLIQRVGVVLDGLCTTPRSPLHTGALGNGPFPHGEVLFETFQKDMMTIEDE